MVTRTHKGDGIGTVFVSEKTISELHEIYSDKIPEINNAYERQTRVEHSHERATFHGGFRHTKDAVALLEKGWKEGSDRLKDLVKKVSGLVPAPIDRKRKPTWADDGDTLDVDRALAGQWDTAYRVATRKWSPGPTVIDLCVSWEAVCFRTQEEFFWSGAAMLAVTDLLEEAGYSVRITACNAVYGANKADLFLGTVVIKDAGEPLRLDGLAGIACHVGVYRTFGFRHALNSPFEIGENMGYPKALSSVKDRLMENGEWPVGGIIIDSAYTELAATDQIKQAIKQVEEMNTSRLEGY